MKFLIWFRSAVVTFLVFPWVTLVLCSVSIFGSVVLRSHEFCNHVNQLWGRTVCALYGVRVRVPGTENIPHSGAMFLFNHTSFFDIISMYAVFPFLRFGAKIELFKIPIFGATMRALGTLPIARANREAAIRVLQEAYDRARKGEKFALSPEGGRGEEGRLLPFKVGPFLFAIEAGVPLVPVTIQGAQSVWPKGDLIPATHAWSSEIRLTVLPPVSTAGKTSENRSELQQAVRAEMKQVLGLR